MNINRFEQLFISSSILVLALVACNFPTESFPDVSPPAFTFTPISPVEIHTVVATHQPAEPSTRPDEHLLFIPIIYNLPALLSTFTPSVATFAPSATTLVPIKNLTPTFTVPVIITYNLTPSTSIRPTDTPTPTPEETTAPPPSVVVPSPMPTDTPTPTPEETTAPPPSVAVPSPRPN